MVPVLCGSLFEQLVLGDLTKPPSEFSGTLVPVLDCLGLDADRKGQPDPAGGRSGFLSHIGPKFGDRNPGIQIARDSKVS